MKKLLASFTSLIFFLCSFSLVVDAKANDNNSLIDVNESFWAANEIYTVVREGYMDFYEDGTFKPNQAVTRGEAASAIAKSLEIPLESKFNLKATDVLPSNPYYAVIRKLAELGIIDNHEKFYPDQPLLRSQTSRMIALAYNIEVDGSNKSKFKDYRNNYWAKDYIESLADAKIIKGMSKTKFSPKRFITRAELAVLIVRGKEFKRKVENLEVVYDYLAKDYIDTVNNYKSWSNEIVTLVNNVRKKEGKQELQQNLSLNQLAIIKSKDMIKRSYFEHRSPFYGNPWDMATLFDYRYTSFGENIARNFNSPADVFAAWMASPSHRENILRDNYTTIGVGIEKDKKGNYYWVQLFSSE